MNATGIGETAPPGDRSACDVVIRRATRSTKLRVAQRLVAGTARDPDAGQRFLDAAALHGIDLKEMWFWADPKTHEPVEDCLIVAGSGGLGLVFTSTPAGEEREAGLAELIERACEASTKTQLAQALLEPSESAVAAAFERAGFRNVGRLEYLRRRTPARGEYRAALTRAGWPDEASVRMVGSADDSMLVDLLDRTYIDTLDCPELCGLRDTRDVLESHRATGRYDANLWWLLELDGTPEGVMLLNPSPEQETIELVYLGLAPATRGRGLGRRFMELGLGLAAGRAERHITCAVDERNAPARRLYKRLGFERFALRVALVKPIAQ